MNTREKGAQKEQQVCACLLSAGVEILERNFRSRQVADYYRLRHHCAEDTPVRFDVVAVDGEKICWIKNAFDYVARC